MFAAGGSALKVPWEQFDRYCRFACAGNASKSGWLTKRGNKRKNWKKRYFVLVANVLFYLETPHDPSSAVGLIYLEQCSINRPASSSPPTVEHSHGNTSATLTTTTAVTNKKSSSHSQARDEALFAGQPFGFTVTTVDGRVYFLSAKSDEQRTGWIDALHKSSISVVSNRLNGLRAELEKKTSHGAELEQRLARAETLCAQREERIRLLEADREKQLLLCREEFRNKIQMLEQMNAQLSRNNEVLRENNGALYHRLKQEQRDKLLLTNTQMLAQRHALNYLVQSVDVLKQHFSLPGSYEDLSQPHGIGIEDESSILLSTTAANIEEMVSVDYKDHPASGTLIAATTDVHNTTVASTYVNVPDLSFDDDTHNSGLAASPMHSIHETQATGMRKPDCPLPPVPKDLHTHLGFRSASGELQADTKATTFWVGTWNVGTVDPLANIKSPTERAHVLSEFVPIGYDVYVLGLQEGINDSIFDALAIRLAGSGLQRVELRSRNGSVVDRVKGRGDGAIVSPKFTAMACFVRRQLLADGSCSII